VTLADVQTEIQSIQSTINARRLEKDRKEKLRNDNIAKLTKAKEERNKVVEQKLRITTNLRNQESMQQQKKDLESESVVLRTSISELNKKLPGIRAEINRTVREISDLRKKGEGQLAHLMKEKGSLERKKDRVHQLHAEIEEFTPQMESFEAEAKKHKECEDALSKCDDKIKDLTQEIEILANEVNTQEVGKGFCVFSCNILYLCRLTI